ncbi:MAG: hypothetical protein VXW91_04125 [Pseudomonadota bacterium]|nr:hypothetical protein [Pseudomonadota bacterium]MEC8666192.1 hypothetical protein [Pseudomonadota bacterium]
MSEEPKVGLAPKLTGAFLGAVLCTAPVYVVGSEVVSRMATKCFTDFNVNAFNCIQNANTVGSVFELGMLFTAVGGGVLGWRKGKKMAMPKPPQP